MKTLLLILFPFLAFGQITTYQIGAYPDTSAPYDSMQFVAQPRPKATTPFIYRKIYGVQLRTWMAAGLDSAGCATTINCDSTGTGDMVRQATPTIASPTITGVLSNTGRDTTAGRIASHGSIKSDSNLTSATMNLTGGGANNGYVCYTASTHAFTVSDTSCPHP